MSDRKPPVSGKGDKSRTINNKNWRSRYDAINWGTPEKPDMIIKDEKGREIQLFLTKKEN